MIRGRFKNKSNIVGTRHYLTSMFKQLNFESYMYFVHIESYSCIVLVLNFVYIFYLEATSSVINKDNLSEQKKVFKKC